MSTLDHLFYKIIPLLPATLWDVWISVVVPTSYINSMYVTLQDDTCFHAVQIWSESVLQLAPRGENVEQNRIQEPERATDCHLFCVRMNLFIQMPQFVLYILLNMKFMWYSDLQFIMWLLKVFSNRSMYAHPKLRGHELSWKEAYH